MLKQVIRGLNIISPGSYRLNTPNTSTNLARSCGASRNAQCDTTQSSTYSSLSSGIANDGQNATICCAPGSCTHTGDDFPSNWRLDFGSTALVAGGKIWGRSDHIPSMARLDHFGVYVGDDPVWLGNPKCYTSGTGDHLGETFECVGVGRYLHVVLPVGSVPLSICEIEVQHSPSTSPRSSLFLPRCMHSPA